MKDYIAIEKGEEYLSHHGVKGMRWGIRHDPERVGALKRAIKRVGSTTIRSLKRASSAAYKYGKKASYRHTQNKIERAISSGNSAKINKVFSKMNDSQANRAINRMNQMDAISRSRIEAGRRSVKNARYQRRLDTLTLRNQIKQQKHPTQNRMMDTAANNVTNELSKTFAKELARGLDYKALKKMYGSTFTDDEIKRMAGFQASKKALKSVTVKSTK